MKTKQIGIICAVLRKEIGRSWPFLLLKSMMKKRALFNGTHWAKENTEESRFFRQYAPLASLYGVLSKKLGRGEALRIITRIIIPVVASEQMAHFRSLGVEDKKGIERLRPFYVFMGEGGSGRFAKRKLIVDSGNELTWEVRHCPFTRFSKELGMVEIVTGGCKVDNAFYLSGIPDYKFSRGDSWRNTMAYGNEHCIFSFKKKENPPDECYIRETPLLDYTNPLIPMLFEELDLFYRSDLEKISHSYAYVRREIRAVRYKKKRKSATAVLRKHRGDDISRTILFMALLRAGGIPCRAHFVTTREGIKSWADVYTGDEWVSTARWTVEADDGVSASPVGWEKEGDDVSWNKSLIEDHGVFNSPDDFLKSRSSNK